MTQEPRWVENVPWWRHVVSYMLRDGRRRRMVHWSPGTPWVHTEVARRLDDFVGIESIKPGSVSIKRIA